MAKREWSVWAGEHLVGDGGYDEAGFRQSVREALLDIEPIGHRAGGAFVVMPVRERDENGRFETVGWVVSHETAPAVKRQEPQVRAVPDPDPDPEAEEPTEAA